MLCKRNPALSSSGAVCNRGGLRVSNCTLPGRMIRPDDFFVQSYAAPDVKAIAEGKALSRSIDPMNHNYSSDPILNMQIQQFRDDSKRKLQQLIDKRTVTPTQ